MESANKECNSTKKSGEEYLSCKFKLTSVEAEEGQVASGEPCVPGNSAKGTKRKRSIKNNRAHCPRKMPRCCDDVKPQKKIPIPPLPSILPPVNLIHRDVVRAWCQQLKLSTKGPKLDGYKRLCEHAYPHQKNIPATAEEARILSPSRRKSEMDKVGLRLERSDKKVSSEAAAPPEEGASALEGSPAPEGVVSTFAPDPDAVFASWSRMTATAVKMESGQSRETCGVRWCVVHGKRLPANVEGWVHLQFHAGQAWVPEKRRRVSALFLLPASNFPPPHLEDNMLCPECVPRDKVLTKSLQ
ncbi:developmental pluripotency-associated protein 4-like [Hippopotamus amphibius kiboko]|uniref:developmental pluripotency-associated protein 4-like n=1 Tax=Hippopotamus amphibius kiboko TaxID=575201 RepID=UPI00259815EF|nr:developmental pluripotency-associated protein 4-like [Hippopotamus amphibius kiboko]